MKKSPVEQICIFKLNSSGITKVDDVVATEEPLQIELEYSTSSGRMRKNIAVTMRSPGNDEELATGFLFTEGIIGRASIQSIKRSPDENSITVILKENIYPVLANVARNFYSSSSCGICGKASIDAIRTNSAFSHKDTQDPVSASIFYQLQSDLKNRQPAFEETGGIHASALFSLDGEFLCLREDVGRHNALDKLIGFALLAYKLPLSKNILFLSGRASFELVQKAVMAGIVFIAAVGAPSSLAVELAKEYGLTLIGFLRDNRFNIYSGEQRIIH